MKIIVWVLISLISLQVFAEEFSVHEFEKTLEDKVRDLANVQFGTHDAIAVSIKAKMKKIEVAPPPPQEESLDVGYLPTPQRNVESETPKAAVTSDNVEGVDVSLTVSSLIDKAAAEQLRKNVQRVLSSYKPKLLCKW